MRLELTDEQLQLVINLVRSRIREIHTEIRRSREYTVHDQLKHDLETLQALLEEEEVQAAENDEQMEAWMGYAETRKVPNNPPPGRGPA